jgi:16S rRNA (cytosine1402-N4)-methyltransferase
LTDAPEVGDNGRTGVGPELPTRRGAHVKHEPVLLVEAIELLNIRSGRTYVDATVGAGGHLKGILQALSMCPVEDSVSWVSCTKSSVIGIDRDRQSLDALKEQIPVEQATLVHANYTDIDEVLSACGLHTISGGIIADLGVSSMQLDNPERGFSFQKDGPLDMRMDLTQPLRAWDIINRWSEKEIADIIYEYGEERHSRLIARNIISSRPVESTLQLAGIVTRAVRYGARGTQHRQKRSANFKERIFEQSHPATRTFQALRIAVNDELGGLRKFIDRCVALLSPGARLVLITFHSLEDRLVKQIFRHYASACHCPPRQPQCTCGAKSELLIITKKPIVANERELLANIRSRSAKLRAGEKIG